MTSHTVVLTEGTRVVDRRQVCTWGWSCTASTGLARCPQLGKNKYCLLWCTHTGRHDNDPRPRRCDRCCAAFGKGTE